MPAAVAVMRRDYTAVGMRRAAARTTDGNAARRMLAIAHVLDGKTREEAAASCGMDRQTLRDWVHRYNAEGLEGLHDRPRPGPQPRLSPAQEAAVAQWVRQGPTLCEHGVVRWRRIDLARLIDQRFGGTLGGLRFCAALAFVDCRYDRAIPRRTSRPREAFKKTLPIWSPPACRTTRAASRSRSGGRMKPASASKAR